MAAAVDLSLIDEFCDALWLEHGLAKNSLDAYRRDLRLFARWLESQASRRASLHRSSRRTSPPISPTATRTSKPSTANRRLSVLKRFYQLALRERHIAADPCLKMASAKQPLRFVHTLSEAQVEALLAAPTCRRRSACANAPCWS
jgi:integrase/recombinase XerD